MTEQVKPSKAFFDGILAGLIAHVGAWLALVAIDKLFYILGHIAITVALRAADSMGQR